MHKRPTHAICLLFPQEVYRLHAAVVLHTCCNNRSPELVLVGVAGLSLKITDHLSWSW